MFAPKTKLSEIILNHPEFGRFISKYLSRQSSVSNIGFFEMAAMDTIQRLPPSDIQSLQLKRFKKILNYAVKNVPFWKNLWNPTKSEINNLDAIKRIPILTRDKINENPLAFLSTSEDINSCYKLTTSGSTSTPINLYIDRDLFFRRVFSMRYALKVFGQNPWSNILRLNYKDMPWCSYQGHYYDLALAEKNLSNFYNLIREHRYDAFYGTTSHLLWLADLIRKTPLDYQIKFAVSRSEYLSAENRRHIEEVFGCEVFNIYASREFGPLAQECRFQNGFHLNEERFLFEIVDDRGNSINDGSAGKILVTSFDNKTMPFIRYEIGDLGRFIPGKCKCGLETKRISFEGRSCDFIYLPANRKFPLIQLLYIINLPGKIKSYQFVQKIRKSLKIRIVPDREYNKKTAEYIKKEILKKTGCDKKFVIDIELTDEIPLLPSGKSRVLVTEIRN